MPSFAAPAGVTEKKRREDGGSAISQPAVGPANRAAVGTGDETEIPMNTPTIGQAGRSDDSSHYAKGIPCPCCGRAAYRVQRNFMDLFINMFVSVHRYRCGSMSCIWEGNVRLKRLP